MGVKTKIYILMGKCVPRRPWLRQWFKMHSISCLWCHSSRVQGWTKQFLHGRTLNGFTASHLKCMDEILCLTLSIIDFSFTKALNLYFNRRTLFINNSWFLFLTVSVVIVLAYLFKQLFNSTRSRRSACLFGRNLYPAITWMGDVWHLSKSTPLSIRVNRHSE